MLRNVIAMLMIVTSLMAKATDQGPNRTSFLGQREGTGASPSPVPSCDDVLKACDEAVEKLKRVVEKQDEYLVVIERQRDRAVERLKDAGDSGLPFYFWLAVGAASAVTIIGIRR